MLLFNIHTNHSALPRRLSRWSCVTRITICCFVNFASFIIILQLFDYFPKSSQFQFFSCKCKFTCNSRTNNLIESQISNVFLLGASGPKPNVDLNWRLVQNGGCFIDTFLQLNEIDWSLPYIYHWYFQKITRSDFLQIIVVILSLYKKYFYKKHEISTLTRSSFLFSFCLSLMLSNYSLTRF